MKILLVYPHCPDTFWSFRHALGFISKKALVPPLGLLTISAMLPSEWEKRLVDMNVTDLTDEDIEWADYVFISAMLAQQTSTREVINRCKRFGTKSVAGGPLFSTGCKELGFDDVDHLVLGEAEITLAPFLEDLESGHVSHVYTSKERPDIGKTSVPTWSLINMEDYSAMNIQYSRGCPFSCEFCDVVILDGHRPRTKDKAQVLAELDALYEHGWRGDVFIVDDNFIGNKKKLKSEILPAMIEWMQAKKYPFALYVQASIDLANDGELMGLMFQAGIDRVFIGIETPNEQSLTECNKLPNQKCDLVASVRRIQSHGLEVRGGFIVGFDHDPPSIFRSQINLIQESGIATAHVGLLNAPPETRLYQRMKKENRLLSIGSGDPTDGSMNFVPKMHYKTLINGHKHILQTIYAPKEYYERVKIFFREHKPRGKRRGKLRFYHIKAFIKSIWLLGIKEKERQYYWKLLGSTLVRYPQSFPLSVRLAILGYHFHKSVETYISMPDANILGIQANWNDQGK